MIKEWLLSTLGKIFMFFGYSIHMNPDYMWEINDNNNIENTVCIAIIAFPKQIPKQYAPQEKSGFGKIILENISRDNK